MSEANGTSAAHVEEKAAVVAQSAPKSALSFLPQNWDDAFRIAKYLSQSQLLPDALRGQDKLYDVLFIIATGQEFGLHPIQAVREIAIVKGKPYLSALLRVALVKQAPVCEYFRMVESDATKAVFETKRKGEGVSRMTYTIEEARQAGLVGRIDKQTGKLLDDNWNKDPALMLRRRCEGRLADEVYPDWTRGSYNKEELDDRQPEVELNPAPLRQVGVTSAPPSPPEEAYVFEQKPQSKERKLKVADIPPSQSEAVKEAGDVTNNEAGPPPFSEYERLCVLLKECETPEQVDTLAAANLGFKGEPGQSETLRGLFRDRRKALESRGKR